jgi:hypothetical protein
MPDPTPPPGAAYINGADTAFSKPLALQVAPDGPVLTAAQRETLAAALSDAIEYRGLNPEGVTADCADCTRDFVCGDHTGDAEKAASYRALAERLGIEVDL